MIFPELRSQAEPRRFGGIRDINHADVIDVRLEGPFVERKGKVVPSIELLSFLYACAALNTILGVGFQDAVVNIVTTESDIPNPGVIFLKTISTQLIPR